MDRGLYVARGIMKVVAFVFAVVCVVFGVLTVKHISAYKDYVPVPATVIYAWEDYSYSGDETNVTYYREVSYEYDDTTYFAEQKSLTSYENKINSEVTVKCNPENPSELEDTYTFYVFVMLLAIFGFVDVVFLIVLAIMKRVSKKQLNNGYYNYNNNYNNMGGF